MTDAAPAVALLFDDVELGARIPTQLANRLLQGQLRTAIWPAAGHGVERVGSGRDTCLQRDGHACDAIRHSLTVHALVV